jgi:Ca2+-binding RTX toxin-like protein
MARFEAFAPASPAGGTDMRWLFPDGSGQPFVYAVATPTPSLGVRSFNGVDSLTYGAGLGFSLAYPFVSLPNNLPVGSARTMPAVAYFGAGIDVLGATNGPVFGPNANITIRTAALALGSPAAPSAPFDPLVLLGFASGGSVFVDNFSNRSAQSDPATGLSWLAARYFAGNDSLYGNAGGDVLTGFAGDDTAFGGAGDDTLFGHDGNDTLVGGAGADEMTGGAGDDQFFVDGAGDRVVESPGAGTDTVWASLAGYTVAANVEIARLTGAGASLTAIGAATLVANPDLASTLQGGDGNDTLWAIGGLAHTLDGGGGNDVLRALDGAAALRGGAGNDLYDIRDTRAVVTELPGGGADLAFVSASGWTAAEGLEGVYLLGAATFVSGSAGADTLVANPSLGSTLDGLGGPDALWGGAGDDELVGGDGDDALRGGAGNDLLEGMAGNDQLVGGAGADRFAFATPGWGYDQIFDFGAGDALAFDPFATGVRSRADLLILVFEAVGNTAVLAPDGSRIDLYGVRGLSDGQLVFA